MGRLTDNDQKRRLAPDMTAENIAAHNKALIEIETAPAASDDDDCKLDNRKAWPNDWPQW